MFVGKMFSSILKPLIMIGKVAKINGELKKTVIVMIKTCEDSVKSDAVYVINKNYKLNQEVSFPAHYKIVDWKEAKLKSGETVMLKTLGI